MSIPVLALILVLPLAIWFFLRRRNASNTRDTKPVARSGSSNSAYHAVSIKFPGSACKAARDMKGRRFLSTAAPRLPLRGCEMLECNCRFVHHKDRRAGSDRRSPFAPSGFGGGTGAHEEEQRGAKDRRADPDDDLF